MREWIDDIISDNIPKVIFIACIAWVLVCCMCLYIMIDTVTTVVRLQVLVIGVQGQQDANRRDIQRLIDDQYYLRQQLKEVRR